MSGAHGPSAAADAAAGARARRARAYELRAALRPLAVSRRVALCARHTWTDPTLTVHERADGSRTASWHGVISCERAHSCPVCAQKRAARRAADVVGLVAGLGGRWQMVTLTVPHHAGEPLALVLDRLHRAWRGVRTHRATRGAWEARVTASVRAVEVTHGPNGWHPHIHVLWRSEEWTGGEREALEAAWCAATGAVPGVGVVWSRPLEPGADGAAVAGYVSKAGLEVAGVAKDCTPEGAPAPRSVWTLAARAAAGDAPSVERWREYQRAMARRRVFELDDRSAGAVAAGAIGAAVRALHSPPTVVRTLRAALYAEQYRGLVRLEARWPSVLLDVAEAPDPMLAVGAALTLAGGWVQTDPPRGPPTPQAVRPGFEPAGAGGSSGAGAGGDGRPIRHAPHQH